MWHFRAILGVVLSWSLTGAGVAMAQESANPRKIALLIGVNRYDKPVFSDLNYAERDVEEMASELRSLGFDVTLLKGSGEGEQRATRTNIMAALERLVVPLTKNDVMLVMLSGHGQQLDTLRPNGTTRNDGYYCPVDAVSNRPDTLISLSYVLDDVLETNVGRKLLLVDACRDTPKDPSRGSRGIQGKRIDLPEGTAVLFSCLAGQQSYENDELQHGLFTYCVLDALRGAGAHEGEVSWTDMVAHVNRQMAGEAMRKRMAKPQEPISAGGVPYTVLGRIGTPPGILKPDAVTTNTIGMKLLLIPAGEFMMGSPASEADRSGDEAEKQVQITQEFLLGQYEVTQAEWTTVMNNNLSHFSSSGENKGNVVGLDTSRFPVEGTNFYDAMEFCNQLSVREGLPAYYEVMVSRRQNGQIAVANVTIKGGNGYRLPTEAEWEYSCRAGTTTAFHFGSQFGGVEASAVSAAQRPANVGSYAPNSFGLYDMHGNVSEWCMGSYDTLVDFERAELNGDEFISSVDAVHRGGGWRPARSAQRTFQRANLRDHTTGFRVARTP